ncbi:hypothetical protein EDB84DRAFT_1278781, partial [Lactarius hengduanensis]
RKTSTEISIDLDVPLRVVQRVKQTWNHIGRVCRSREFMGRHPLLSPEQTQFMLALIEHSPDIYLDEIQELLQELHGIKISVSSIWRTLKRLGMSAKKVCSILHLFLPEGFIKTCSKLTRVAAG